MVNKAAQRREEEKRKADRRDTRQPWVIGLVFFVVGFLVSWSGVPSLQDLKWSNDKLLVKNVGDSYIPDVFGFPIELINTSRCPIKDVEVTWFPQNDQSNHNVVNIRQAIKLIEPKEATPMTIRGGNYFNFGPPKMNQNYSMAVGLSGVYSCYGWKQHFNRMLYFVGKYDGANAIHWHEQSASADDRIYH